MGHICWRNELVCGFRNDEHVLKKIYAQCCVISDAHSPMQFPPVPARTEHRQKSQLNTCVPPLVYLLRIKNSQALSFHSIYTRQLTFHLPAMRPEQCEC